MPAIKKTIAILFLLTLGAFALVWLHFINEGKHLDTSGLHMTPLRVLAYPTFVSSYGPGPELAREFEKRCKCKVELLNAGDSALILEKVLAKGDDYAVDVIIGLDQLLVPAALEKLKWRSLDIQNPDIDGKLKLEGQTSLWPIDWAPLTFIYKKSKVEPPKSIQDLLDVRFKDSVSLPNPVTSTTGRQFFAWVYDNLGDEEGLEFFDKLAEQNFVFADSWSSSYGLFQRGPIKMSFSYLTSAVFHWEAEKDENLQPVIFSEPLAVQIEYMGVPERCRLCDEGEAFVKFLLEPGAQSLIMQKNYMFPVIESVRSGSVFEKLPKVSVLPPRSKMTDEWMKKALERVSQK